MTQHLGMRKRQRKSRLNIYILGLAVIAAAVAGYYLPTKRPESGVTMTPKEYIELVEQKKQQRRQFERERQSEQQKTDDTAREQR